MIRTILAAILVSLLTACGLGDAPDRATVEQAIVMQVNQTQQELSQQLRQRGEVPSAKVDRVKIESQKRMAIEDSTGYQVRGTYDVTLNARQRITQHQNSFEVYLQRQEDSWQLARPQAEGGWVTQLVEAEGAKRRE